MVILGTPGVSTYILYHAMLPLCEKVVVITEQPQSRTHLVRRRLKKLGWFKVGGQLIFQLLLMPAVHTLSAKRWRDIIAQFQLQTQAVPDDKSEHVFSANSIECVQRILHHQPDVVLLSGTRILKKEFLEMMPCPVINIHAGITPQYRGVHGAYWALVMNDRDRCGTTLHFVDSGIDTGQIIAQTLIKPTSADSFATYPLLQLAAGVSLLKENLESVVSGEVSGTNTSGESRLWYHPTAFSYLKNRWFRGIR